MSQVFVPDDNSSVSEALEEDRPNSDSAISEQDVVLLTVVGSPSGVRETILTTDWVLLKLAIGAPYSVLQIRSR